MVPGLGGQGPNAAAARRGVGQKMCLVGSQSRLPIRSALRDKEIVKGTAGWLS